MQVFTPFPTGCEIPAVLGPAIDFSQIVVPAASVTVDLTKPPANKATLSPLKIDNLASFVTWEDFKNRVYNNCNAAAWANTRRIVTSRLATDEVYPSMEQVIEFYKTQNPSFVGGDTKPYGQDDGMNIQKGLEYLVQTGGPDGKRALAFARVDASNLEAVKMAIAIFGSIWVGLRVYSQTQLEFYNRQAWKQPRQPTQKKPSGHAVVVGAYDTHYRAITWGQVAALTTHYWEGCYNNDPKRPNVFDAYVVIWAEHVGTRRFMQGVSLKQLAAQYLAITSKKLDLPVSQYNTLYRCSASATDPATLTIQAIRAEKSYAITSALVTTSLLKTKNDILVTESNDLYLIKREGTASNMIEVHRARSPSYDKVTTFVSGFSITDSKSGIWTIDNGDLYFTKTENTSSGNIEVWWATQQSKFTKIESYTTGMVKNDIGVGTYAISGGDLYAISDTLNNNSDFVQLECLQGEANYSTESRRTYETAFVVNDIKGKGNWCMDSDGNLYLFKNTGTTSGLVELHIATAESDYKSIDHFSTGFMADGADLWII